MATSQGPSLYEDDLHEWASRQAALIRANRIDELDLAHVAEELDGVGSELYRRLESSFTVLSYAEMGSPAGTPYQELGSDHPRTEEAHRPIAGEEPFLEGRAGGGHDGSLRIRPLSRVR